MLLLLSAKNIKDKAAKEEEKRLKERRKKEDLQRKKRIRHSPPGSYLKSHFPHPPSDLLIDEILI